MKRIRIKPGAFCLMGDYLLVNKMAYRNSLPERGDVVVFRSPPNRRQAYIKRVVGLPGDTVAVRGGEVYVNGEQLGREKVTESAFTSIRDGLEGELYYETNAGRTYAILVNEESSRIGDHEEKVVWSDRFERLELRNGWVRDEETGPEILMRDGIPTAGNMLQQELAILTGAVESMIVDVQCIMQGLVPVAERYHTEVITTSPKVKIKGATHIEFDEHHALSIAKEILKEAIDNYKHRGDIQIPDVTKLPSV